MKEKRGLTKKNFGVGGEDRSIDHLSGFSSTNLRYSSVYKALILASPCLQTNESSSVSRTANVCIAAKTL